MKGFGGFLFLVFVLFGCGSSVRDSVVYEAEVDFVRTASEDSSLIIRAFIEENCICRGGEFTSMKCSNAADTVLVIESRMDYHLDFMLYLGDVTDERPPAEPPVIPDANSLCSIARKEIDIPVKYDAEILDDAPYREVDSGVEGQED